MSGHVMGRGASADDDSVAHDFAETAHRVPPIGYTLSDLGAMFPDAHFEWSGTEGELVIYTGWVVNDDVPGGTTLRWMNGMYPEPMPPQSDGIVSP